MLALAGLEASGFALMAMGGAGGLHAAHLAVLLGMDRVLLPPKPGLAVALGLLEDHLGHCVTQAVAEGGETAAEKVREASDAIARLVKS